MKKKSIFLGVLGLIMSTCICATNVEAVMSFEKAMAYQEANPKDVRFVEKKVKDIYGEKNKRRYFAMLSANGLIHTGNSIVGKADRTMLNYIVDYGFKNIEIEPYAAILWYADLKGDPEKGYEPKKMHIVFEDDFIKEFDLQGWEYKREVISGLFSFATAHNYRGEIKLDRFDIYELYQHGAVVSVSVDAGDGTIRHFFYSGKKDADEKATLTRGIRHSMKILEIVPEKMHLEYAEHRKKQEEERIAKLRAEVEREIREDAEREALKKQILEEMKQKEKKQ